MVNNNTELQHKWDNDIYRPASFFKLIPEYSVFKLLIELNGEIQDLKVSDIKLENILFGPDIKVIMPLNSEDNDSCSSDKCIEHTFSYLKFHKLLTYLQSYHPVIQFNCVSPVLPLIYNNTEDETIDIHTQRVVYVVDSVTIKIDNTSIISDAIAYTEINNQSSLLNSVMNKYNVFSNHGYFCREGTGISVSVANLQSRYLKYKKEYLFKSSQYPHGIIIEVSIISKEEDKNFEFRHREETLLDIIFEHNYLNQYSGDDALQLIAPPRISKCFANITYDYNYFVEVCGQLFITNVGCFNEPLEIRLRKHQFKYRILNDVPTE